MPAEALLLVPIKVPGPSCKQPLNAEAVPEPPKMLGHDDPSNKHEGSVPNARLGRACQLAVTNAVPSIVIRMQGTRPHLGSMGRAQKSYMRRPQI